MLSDDGSKFAINDILLVDMDQLQAPTYGYANNKVLYKGLNRINVLYFQGPLTQLSLRLDWKGPTSAGLSTLQLIGNSYLTH